MLGAAVPRQLWLPQTHDGGGNVRGCVEGDVKDIEMAKEEPGNFASSGFCLSSESMLFVMKLNIY